MEIKELKQKEVVVGYICDICKQSCNKISSGEGKNYESYEFATLYARWGYYSNKDLTSSHCHICENCFDKVKDFIENNLKGTVRTAKLSFISPEPLAPNRYGIDYIIRGEKE